MAILLQLLGVVEAQNLLWAKRAGAGGIFSDQGYGVAVDSSGNSYVTGFFSSSATFGQGEANETTLTAAGAEDMFVAKYNSNGTLLWVKRASATSAVVQGLGIAADSSGNSYVTGLYFLGSATFGQGETNQTTLSALGSQDIFVAKYDPNGALVWAKGAGGLLSDQAFAITVDGSGNSHVTGFFSFTAIFGQGEANQTVLTADGVTDIFVAKYDANGALLWAKRAGGANVDQGSGIALDSSGNSYVTGYVSLTATFGAGEANQTTLTQFGNKDIFVAKYNSNGALQWAKRAGATLDDEGLGIAVDSGGNSYVAGYFMLAGAAAIFGQGEPNQTTLTSAGSEDIFVAKFDSNGALVWAKRAGSAGGLSDDRSNAIALDSLSNSYVTGYFSDSATFGQGEPNETTLTSAGNNDIYVAKYNSNGALQWARRAGSTAIDEGFAITVDSAGNPIVTGYIAGSATFGQGEANQITLIPAGGFDIFVAKFAGSNSSVPILVACPSDSLQTAINLAAPGSTILVSGACSENILIRNEKQRITIDGAGAGAGTRATINGNSSSPVFNVRGKGILIQNFTVTGGSVGDYINRGSNAVLNNNIVQNSASDGVVVDELAFAVLTSNTIQNHPGAGVVVSEASTARIGFNADSETTASANTIQNNGVGVLVSNRSSARIVGNHIVSNNGDGVRVVRDSLGEISSNLIDLNTGTGISVLNNSGVNMGEDTGSTIFQLPNSTVNNNGGFGYRCNDGSFVDGRLGTLSGSTGNTNDQCVDSLIP